MAAQKNPSLIFKKIPSGLPVAGEHLVVEDRSYDPSTSPPPGGLVVQVLYASYDPYLRDRMRDASVESYVPAFEMNAPIENFGVCRVLKSDHPSFKEGDHLSAPGVAIQRFTTITKDGLASAYKIDPASPVKDLRHYIGALGMTGLTAYSTLYEVGKPKKGETIFISSAAGAVGQMVGQLAKHEGLKVIGSVGSDEKLKFITEELGFDSGFNYKKETPLKGLTRLAPDGLDIYFDNVAGEHLDAALESMKLFGRIIACGTISQDSLEPAERYGVKNMGMVVEKRLNIHGVLVFDIGAKWEDEHRKNVGSWIADGSFKATISETDGIEKGPKGFVGLLKGENFGKAILKL